MHPTSSSTIIASAYTICSFCMSTLPHELASFKVELEYASSLTSATVAHFPCTHFAFCYSLLSGVVQR